MNDRDELPRAARRALGMLAHHATLAHENNQVRTGRTREIARANHQRAYLLLASLGSFTGTERVEALIAEQTVSDEDELPKELIQNVEPEPANFHEARRSSYASIWDVC